MERTWTKSRYAHIQEAHDAAKLWEENPSVIKKTLSKDGKSYILKFITEDATYIQKFSVENDGSLSGVRESENVKPQRRIRSARRTNKKPAKVYVVPNPPLEEFIPGPERKVSQWRYEQVRWTLEEWKNFYTKEFKTPCEVYEVMLVRYPNDSREIEYYKTKEGHIVSRTLSDPLKFPGG